MERSDRNVGNMRAFTRGIGLSALSRCILATEESFCVNLAYRSLRQKVSCLHTNESGVKIILNDVRTHGLLLS